VATIAIIGTGYVGLTTGACFSHLGHDVICADIDEEKIARLRAGEVPIVEKGLDRLVDEGPGPDDELLDDDELVVGGSANWRPAKRPPETIRGDRLS